MKALILCGGFARRLEPIGEFIPKALLTLNGVPLIEYIMKDLENNGQIDEIIISTNRRFANQFEYWLKLKKGAGYRKEVRLVIEPSNNSLQLGLKGEGKKIWSGETGKRRHNKGV